MSTYSFHTIEPCGYFGREYPVSLFHLREHLALQSLNNRYSFFVLHEKSKKLFAEVHFHGDGPAAISPMRAPFGSCVFSEKLPPEVLFDFILFAEEELRKDKINTIILKPAPAGYFPEQHNLLVPVLLNLNYGIQQAEVSAIVPVTERPFPEIIDSWENRKLRQAREAELVARLIHDENLEMVYSFILECRQQKHYSLSMTFEEVKLVVSKFPERFVLFGVFDQDNLAAAAITVRVTDDVLYNFYSDHHTNYDHFSPVVMLIESEYEYCRHQGLRLLDLGTSSAGGKLNFPLLDFKMRLGGMPSPKFTFVKTI
ncbi:MAG: GNAT family N-acetyltransferase [Flammeovirgaceae bacterium]|nr:MAG: GNAT family N-acetyltransferase [Flammeovirgaceae bacterium]